jgi:hypothetical protein
MSLYVEIVQIVQRQGVYCHLWMYNITSNLNVHMTMGFRTARYLYINIPYNFVGNLLTFKDATILVSRYDKKLYSKIYGDMFRL